MPESKKSGGPASRHPKPAARARSPEPELPTAPAQPAPSAVPVDPVKVPEPRPLFPGLMAPIPAQPLENQISEMQDKVSNMWNDASKWADAYMATMSAAQAATLTAATRTFELFNDSWERISGKPPEPVLPADKRFQDSAWKENAYFDYLKQAYLINSRWFLDIAEGLKDVDPEMHHRAVFYTKEFVDALSPANFPWSNPVAMEEAIRTGGANLTQGATNLLEDLLKGQITQVPAGSFQVGKDLACTPGKVVYRNPLIELIQYAPTTPQVREIPILFVPPWVNKYYILDLSPNNSMVKYLVDNGFTVFMISWRNPDSSLRHLGWEDYMSMGPLSAIRVTRAITGADQVNMVGYCIGGLLLETTLAYLAANDDKSVKSATFFAKHEDFDNVGDLAAFISEPQVAFLEWFMDMSGGYLDSRNMGATFNMLRANDLLWYYVFNNYLMGKDPTRFDLLFWNNDSTRVPERIHSYYLRTFFLEKRLGKPHELKLLGTEIDLKKITIPSFSVGSIEDHIVPWKSAFAICDLVGGPTHFILCESGHIAGIINPPSAHKRGYWRIGYDVPSPDEWLRQAEKVQGSWWPEWLKWLDKEETGTRAHPPMGNAQFPPLADAPGSYVLAP